MSKAINTAAMKNATMRAGTLADIANAAGWVLEMADGSARKWISEPTMPRGAAGRIMRSGGYATARLFIVENGKLIILA